ncbi:MAG: ATP-binding protein [Alphaproteobacteria bacterium]
MIKSNERVHQEHVLWGNKQFKLLKGAIIYGANASGKSNLIDAIRFAQNFIIGGWKNKGDINPQQFLLDEKSVSLDTYFEFEYIINSEAFSYGFIISKKEVVEEWLCKINKNESVDDLFLYTRKGNEFEIGEYFQKQEKYELAQRFEFVKNNELFLGKSLELNTKLLEKHINWFKSMQIIKPTSKPITIVPNLQNGKFKKFLLSLLKSCDTGIEGIKRKLDDIKTLNLPSDLIADLMSSLDNNEAAVVSENIGNHIVVVKYKGELKALSLQFIHKDVNGNEKIFRLSQESDGTKRLVDLSVALFADNLNVLIIDELDRSLHPALTQFLTKSFIKNNDKQLIITTHETSLLNKNWLRRDEVWFVNKEKSSGESKLKPLSDYKQRYDKELRKAYLDGRFHGVPVLGERAW